MSDSLRPHGLKPTRLFSPLNSPGKNTRVGSYSLSQGTFPTQTPNPDLLHCRRILSWQENIRPLHKLGSSFPTPPSLTLVTTPITVQSQQTCFCFLNIYDYFLHDCMSSFFHVFRTYWFIRVRRSTGAGVVKVVKSEMDSPSWRLKPSWNVFIILYTFFFSFFLEYLPLFFNAWKIHIHILRFRSKIPLLEIFLHYFSLRKIILS